MRKWLPLLTVCLGTFMLLIDVTIVNVALPDMRNDLDASFSSLQWVVDGYALAMAALMLGAGSIADLAGHRRTYLAGLVLFAISSLVCGFAPNPTVLIIARVAQVGAATMSCTTFALLNNSYDGRDRGAAYGVWALSRVRPVPSGRSSAACSPTSCRGGGSSLSTCRSVPLASHCALRCSRKASDHTAAGSIWAA